jgi:D-3-phosphoglycerate dehydrogenase
VHEPLNFVNTPALARERGLKVETARIPEDGAYTSLVTLRMQTRDGEHAVSGTLIGTNHQPRLIDAMGFTLDITPEKHMLFIRNKDMPGMIGRIGSVLGEAGLNIGNMSVGRDEPRSGAAMAVTVDDEVPEEVLKRLLEIEGFTEARSVTL